MINITFASIKNHKQGYLPTTKIKTSKQNDHPMTFKEIKQLKQASNHKNHNINLNNKHLQNQENSFSNAIQDNFNPINHRKHPNKYEKNIKLSQYQLFKSPLSKAEDLHPLTVRQKQVQNRQQIKKGQIQHKIPDNYVQMTPCLNKSTRSMTIDQNSNNFSFMTEKQRQLQSSEHGNISISSKNSFNDSFQLHSLDLSYQEDEKAFKEGMDHQVISSMELNRDLSTNYISNKCINEFQKNQSEIKNMKKSTTLFCATNLYAGEKCLSTVSSNISHSINFSQKFKHYKRQNIKSQKKQQKVMMRLCHFKLQDQIGTGKYGKVYLARHKATGFVCAIKSVSKKLIKQQQLEITFMRQIKIQMYLNHPNIVKLYGVFCDEKNIYLIMQYCSDSHLSKFIRQRNNIPEKEILHILSNLYEAVSFIHCHGIIHRDLKPENVVVEHGVFKLCDFGWAAYSCGDSRTTFCGTPLYVCPQVLKGEQYNEKADIWGLGIITYQLLFGRVPFSIMNQNDLMKIIKDPVYFPAWGYASESLVSFIKRMLNKDPEMRPSISQILTSQIFQNISPFSSYSYRSILGELL